MSTFVLSGILRVPAAPVQGGLTYPSAHRDKTVDTYFGVNVPAPYQWMEKLDNQELHKWVTAENTLTTSYFEKIKLRSWIRKRLADLWSYPQAGVPQPTAGGKLFFQLYSGAQNQGVLYIQDSPTSKPRTLINPNKLPTSSPNVLSTYTPSPDGKYVAYQLSENGSDWKTIRVLDVATGKTLRDTLTQVKFSLISWTNDGKGFFYSRYPAPSESGKLTAQDENQKLYYHRLGTLQGKDTLIYARPEPPPFSRTPS